MGARWLGQFYRICLNIIYTETIGQISRDEFKVYILEKNKAKLIRQNMAARGCVASFPYVPMYTPDRRQSKTLSTIDERGSNIDRKKVFSIAICRSNGDKWQSRHCFYWFLIYVPR